MCVPVPGRILSNCRLTVSGRIRCTTRICTCEHEEVEQWKERDPIRSFYARLKQEGKLTGTEYAAIEAQVEREVQEAVDFAEAGTLEPVEDLLNNVYTPEQLR